MRVHSATLVASCASVLVQARPFDFAGDLHGAINSIFDLRHPTDPPGNPFGPPASASADAGSSISQTITPTQSTTNDPSTISLDTTPTTQTSTKTTSAKGITSRSSSPTETAALNLPYPLRGVNLGNWLVLEAWMNTTLFEGVDGDDQWSFDSTAGAQAKLEQHWATYFTEADFETMAAYGINAVRIPIGFWAYDNDNTPYIKGADAYLEKAIGWARNTGLKVLVDCHGSPGSQNGFENSGRRGAVKWQEDDNLQRSIEVLKTMASKYGSLENADVVFGLELVNEPISSKGNDFATTQAWAMQAYEAVMQAAANKHLQIIMHDGFETPARWLDVGASLNRNVKVKSQARFVVDTHLYQNQDESGARLTQQQHIAKACAWPLTRLLPSSDLQPVYVGEFSAATDICADPDGTTTTAGSSCSTPGCQCANAVDIEHWNQPLKDATRKFVEAQIEAFEHASQGWFIWSYRSYGAWGVEQLVKNGVLGSKVTDRKYPGICGF